MLIPHLDVANLSIAGNFLGYVFSVTFSTALAEAFSSASLNIRDMAPCRRHSWQVPAIHTWSCVGDLSYKYIKETIFSELLCFVPSNKPFILWNRSLHTSSDLALWIEPTGCSFSSSPNISVHNCITSRCSDSKSSSTQFNMLFKDQETQQWANNMSYWMLFTNICHFLFSTTQFVQSNS